MTCVGISRRDGRRSGAYWEGTANAENFRSDRPTMTFAHIPFLETRFSSRVAIFLAASNRSWHFLCDHHRPALSSAAPFWLEPEATGGTSPSKANGNASAHSVPAEGPDAAVIERVVQRCRTGERATPLRCHLPPMADRLLTRFDAIQFYRCGHESPLRFQSFAALRQPKSQHPHPRDGSPDHRECRLPAGLV